MASTLITAIEFIWVNHIKDLYLKGQICSERQIQAELYRHLRNNTDYEVWIEPELHLVGSKLHHTKPDLIITEDKKIIGIMEIKFNLFAGINFTWDIEKLRNLAILEESVPLRTDLSTANWDMAMDNQFTIGIDTCLFFAVIAWEGTQALDYNKWGKGITEKIPNNFYLLSGTVNKTTNRDSDGFELKMIK